jgi:hypothetical protein
MTTAAPEAQRPCPPSAVADQIIPWAQVRKGDLLLWDGEFRTVGDISQIGADDEWLVLLDGERDPTIPAGTHAAVRRYMEG